MHKEFFVLFLYKVFFHHHWYIVYLKYRKSLAVADSFCMTPCWASCWGWSPKPRCTAAWIGSTHRTSCKTGRQLCVSSCHGRTKGAWQRFFLWFWEHLVLPQLSTHSPLLSSLQNWGKPITIFKFYKIRYYRKKERDTMNI